MRMIILSFQVALSVSPSLFSAWASPDDSQFGADTQYCMWEHLVLLIVSDIHSRKSTCTWCNAARLPFKCTLMSWLNIFPSVLIQARRRCGLIKCLNSTFLQDMMTRALLWQKTSCHICRKRQVWFICCTYGTEIYEYIKCRVSAVWDLWVFLKYDSHIGSAGLRSVDFKDQRMSFSYSSIHSVTPRVLWMMARSSLKTSLMSGEDYFSLQDKVTTLLLLTFWSKIKVSNASCSTFLIPVTEHYGIEAHFCQLKKEGWKQESLKNMFPW